VVSTQGLNRFEDISECLSVWPIPPADFGFVKLCDQARSYIRKRRSSSEETGGDKRKRPLAVFGEGEDGEIPWALGIVGESRC